MKKVLLALVLSFALTACGTISNPFTAPTLAAVEESYGVALALSVSYHDDCAKRLIPPSCRTVVPVMQAYGARAQAAVLMARSFVKNNPTLDATSILTLATDAISKFKSNTPKT